MDVNKNEEKQTVFKEEDKALVTEKSSTGLEKNIAGMLCYLGGFITGIIFLLIEKDNRFVRYHALQSIILFAVLVIFSIILTVVSMIPVIGFIGWIIGLFLPLVYLILWIYTMVMAYQGKWFKLPMIGNIAEQQLNKMSQNN